MVSQVSMASQQSSSWCQQRHHGVKQPYQAQLQVFNFNPAFHSVWQLPDSNCDFGAPGVVRKDVGTSPTKVKLTSVGSFYFGCGTPGHCAGGMSLTVEVAATGNTLATCL